MTNDCTIGPVVISGGFYLESGNTYGLDGEETFTIVAPNYQVQQLTGLVTRGDSKKSGDITVRGSNSNDWGPVWIDASSGVSDNDAFPHRGYYLIRDVDVTLLNYNTAKAKLTVELLSTNALEYWEMDYTNGFDNGTVLDHSYPLTETTYYIDEHFTTLDTDIWTDVSAWNMTDSVCEIATNQLHFSGKRTATASPNWGIRSVESVDKIPLPFTATFDLISPDLGTAGYGHFLRMTLSPSSVDHDSATKDAFVVNHDVLNRTHRIRVSKYNTKGSRSEKIKNISASLTTLSCILNVDVDGNATLTYHNGSSYVSFWSGSIALSRMDAVRIIFSYVSQDTADNDVYVDNVHVYSEHDVVLPTRVKVPATGRVISAEDGTRTNTEVFEDPTEAILLQNDSTSLSDIFLNSPRGYSTNNTNSVSRQVTGTYERLVGDKFSVDNGILQLVVGASYIVLNGWNGSEWEYQNAIGIPGQTLDYLKVLNATPESFKFQVNQTIWEMRRGEPFVYVSHPYDVLNYRLRNKYIHDGTTTNSPSANADITMTTIPHAEIFTWYSNMLNVNQATACSALNATTGFQSWASATLTADTTWLYGAHDRSLKVVTPNVDILEGVGIISGYRPSVSVGTDYVAYFVFTGASGTVRPQLIFRDGGGSAITTIDGTNTTLDGTVKTQAVTGQPGAGSTTADLLIRTHVKQSVTFRIGEMMLMTGTSVSSFANACYMDEPTGNWWRKYGMEIMQKDPTTIKSNSIPACEMTGIGVYDNRLTSSDFDYPADLGYEWLNPVDQRLRMVQW